MKTNAYSCFDSKDKCFYTSGTPNELEKAAFEKYALLKKIE